MTQIDDQLLEELVRLLGESAEILEEVRTGEDFEVKCWEKAEEAKAAIKKYKQRNK